jgi:creatinine amidohydrolase
MDVMWQALTAAALCERAQAGAIVLLPVASTEQHGPHLATGVDDVLCSEVCRRAALKLTEANVPVVVAPTVWVGLAEHHMAYGGSFTLTLATYHALLLDLCRSILRDGFTKILIVNGHGGNISALNALTVELTRELDAAIATASYWHLADEEFVRILEDQQSVLHACEAETSMMLAVRPDLVATDRLAEAVGPNAAGASSVLSPPMHRWRSFHEFAPSGVIGDARRSSAEKGERLLEAASSALAEQLACGKPWN